jgi:hypothetical protein
MFWSFDVARFIRSIKFHHLSLHKYFEEHAQKDDEEETFVCPNDSCPHKFESYPRFLLSLIETNLFPCLKRNHFVRFLGFMNSPVKCVDSS